MGRFDKVAYCGLFCPNCGVRCRLPKQAPSLLETMKGGDWDNFDLVK